MSENNPQACLNAAQQLSRDYQTAYRQICHLGMAESVAGNWPSYFLAGAAMGAAAMAVSR
ncbi:MAG: hypothetical protein IPP63_04465 [Chloracidobacterium sp.]|nr:hypothetical protein [Chloracidobacterium sp.]